MTSTHESSSNSLMQGLRANAYERAKIAQEKAEAARLLPGLKRKIDRLIDKAFKDKPRPKPRRMGSYTSENSRGQRVSGSVESLGEKMPIIVTRTDDWDGRTRLRVNIQASADVLVISGEKGHIESKSHNSRVHSTPVGGIIPPDYTRDITPADCVEYSKVISDLANPQVEKAAEYFPVPSPFSQ